MLGSFGRGIWRGGKFREGGNLWRGEFGELRSHIQGGFVARGGDGFKYVV